MELVTRRWMSLPFWLLAAACLLLPGAWLGQPVLDVLYGPNLVVSGMRWEAGASQQRPFDRIVALDGRSVAKAADITAILADHPARSRHQLTVDRGGVPTSYPVTSRRLGGWQAWGVHLPLYIFGLAFLAVATWVSFQRPSGAPAEAFLLLAYSTSAYAFTGAEFQSTHRLWPLYLMFWGIASLTFPYLALTLRQPQRRPGWVPGLGVALALAGLVCFVPEGLATATPWRFEAFHVLHYRFHPLFAAACLLGFLGVMVGGCLRSPAGSLDRRRYALIGAGAAVSFLPVAWVWLLALAQGRSPDPRLASLALVLLGAFPLAIAGAVVRYRLFDVERVIKQVLVYTLTIGILGAIYVASIALASNWVIAHAQVAQQAQIFLVIGLALLLNPLRLMIQSGIDRLFYRDRLALEEVLQRIQRYSTFGLEREQLLVRMAGDVREAMRLVSAAIAMPGAGGWQVTYASGQDTAGTTIPHLPEGPTLAEDDAALAGYAAAVPIRLDDRPVALLLLGGKLSELPFSPQDFRYAELLVAPLGGLIGYLQAMERKQQADFELTRLYEQLDQVNLNVLKNAFGLITAHELRTPLTLVLGNAELLLEGKFGPLGEQQLKAVERIHRYTLALTRSLTDTLDLMLLLQGRTRFTCRPVDLAALARDLCAERQAEAATKGLQLQLDLPEQVPVQADEVRLRQALHHLLDNALKFTAAGGEVTVRARRDGERQALTVRDTGCGISPDRLLTLLGGDAGREAADQGSLGIGLLLAKGNIEGMGGDLRLDSKPGQGTQATVTLPVSPALAPPLGRRAADRD